MKEILINALVEIAVLSIIAVILRLIQIYVFNDNPKAETVITSFFAGVFFSYVTRKLHIED